jgi:hypothetical protein
VRSLFVRLLFARRHEDLVLLGSRFLVLGLAPGFLVRPFLVL